MTCNVTMTKCFTEGLFKDLTVEDKMSFVSWDKACQWASSVSKNPKVNYIVVKMSDVSSGEVYYES